MFQGLYEMRYLLDTQIVVWFFEENKKKLPEHIFKIIKDQDNIIYLSWISLYEVAIKKNLGKVITDLTLNELYILISESPINLIQINLDQLNTYVDLPYIHGDPYDRLLISTAITKRLSFITSDEKIHQYKEIECVWKT